jgi:hypothetical protein
MHSIHCGSAMLYFHTKGSNTRCAGLHNKNWKALNIHLVHRLQNSVSQTVVRNGPSGGPQAVSQEKNIAKIISRTEPMKNKHIHVCASTAFVG